MVMISLLEVHLKATNKSSGDVTSKARELGLREMEQVAGGATLSTTSTSKVGTSYVATQPAGWRVPPCDPLGLRALAH